MSLTSSNLGNKIVVLGVSASGKSLFARRLSSHLNIPLTHMDAIMWEPGWNHVGNTKVREELQKVMANDSWIIEGWIEPKARKLVFDRADTIIYLDYPRLLVTWRYLKRWLKHRKAPRAELNGSPEKFSFKFLKLVFTKGEAISINESLGELTDQSKVIKINSPKKAWNLLQK